MRNTTIIKRINAMFPVVNPRYPIAMIVDDQAVVSAESLAIIGEFEGKPLERAVAFYYGVPSSKGCPWIDPKIEKFCEDNDLFAEWRDPGSVIIYNN